MGRSMPREVFKSWTYTQTAWNSCARTPVTHAIESAVGGDDKSVTFNLFGDGRKNTKKNKKQKKQTLRLDLPDSFDSQVHRVAGLVTHFTSHLDNNDSSKCYDDPVQYTPSACELKHIDDVLMKAVADPASSGLSAAEMYQVHIVDGGLLGEYGGSDWAQWLTTQLERIRLECPPPVPSPSASKTDSSTRDIVQKQQSDAQQINDPAMVRFLEDMSALAGPTTRSPRALLGQWMKVLTTCSSHWCPPQLWWCVATTMTGANLDGMTRPCKESGVPIPSLSLKNWDMFSVLQLLESDVFSAKVHAIVRRVIKYTRTDLAHERFDADWVRDCECMAELLDALRRPGAAVELRKFCDRQKHTTDGGKRTLIYTQLSSCNIYAIHVTNTGVIGLMAPIQVARQAR